MIKDILIMGNHMLLEKSIPINDNEFNIPDLDSLIQDMLGTIDYFNKNSIPAVGIFAVQIGNLKLVIDTYSWIGV